MTHDYINDCGGKYKMALKGEDGKTVAYLICGDRVEVLKKSGDFAEVRATGASGRVPKSVLGGEGLLEIYVIDVGQGDGVLFRTPDDKWYVVDAGVENEEQMTKKGAANFVRWKFVEARGESKVRLDNVIVSHSDFDHYGGLINLFEGKVSRPDRTFDIEVGNFYHGGVGRFADAPKLGAEVVGKVATLPFDDYGVKQEGSFITELLSGKGSFKSPVRPFDGTFGRLADLVGKVPKHVRRLSHRDGHLPGYAPGDGDVTIRLLGPILERTENGEDGLREMGSESVTRNGHSIVLRLDYDKVRVLLTGDSNSASQRLLLSYHPLLEFASDVAKACHHGSDDVDLRFVRAMKARTTVVSSGDNEDYAHPRPRVLGASARYRREAKSVQGETLPPLLYSTELARSLRLAYATRVREAADTSNELLSADTEIKVAESHAEYRRLDDCPVSTDLVYGLINVRTDGERVLCGYMKEQSKDFDLQVFRAGVEP